MDFELGIIEEDVIGKVTDEDGNEEWFNLKNLLNIIIEFINKLIKFEF